MIKLEFCFSAHKDSSSLSHLSIIFLFNYAHVHARGYDLHLFQI